MPKIGFWLQPKSQNSMAFKFWPLYLQFYMYFFITNNNQIIPTNHYFMNNILPFKWVSDNKICINYSRVSDCCLTPTQQFFSYSQTYIKEVTFGTQRKWSYKTSDFLKEVQFIWNFNTDNCLIEVTAWTGCTVYHSKNKLP
jgi:hypothetical protein